MQDIRTGKDLKQWRQENHVTIDEFIQFSGYSKSRLYHLESEDSKLSKKLLSYIDAYNRALYPKDDDAIDAWRHLKSQKHLFIQQDMKKLTDVVAQLLSSKPFEEEESLLSYLDFLIKAAENLVQVKELLLTKSIQGGSAEPELRDILTQLYRDSRDYFKMTGIEIDDK